MLGLEYIVNPTLTVLEWFAECAEIRKQKNGYWFCFHGEEAIVLSADKLVDILANELADNRYSDVTEEDDYEMSRNMIAQADKAGLAYFVYKTCLV